MVCKLRPTCMHTDNVVYGHVVVDLHTACMHARFSVSVCNLAACCLTACLPEPANR